MTTLKITTIGNSVGVVFSKEVLALLNAEKGDQLYINKTPNGIELSVYNERFARHMEAAREIMRENRDALRKLAE